MWLLAILGLIGLITWASSYEPIVSPGRATATPGEPAQRLLPTLEVPAQAGMLAADKGYLAVRKLTNPYRGDEAAAKQGKRLFQANCATCHRPEAPGDGPVGMPLDPRPKDLTLLSHYSHGAGDAGIFRTVKYGIKGTWMAPWDGRMSDHEIWKVSQYVRCLQVGGVVTK